MIYIGQALTATSQQCAHLKWQNDLGEYTVGFNVYKANNNVDAPVLVASDLKVAEWISPPLEEDRNHVFYITSLTAGGKESALSTPVAINNFTIAPVVVKVEKETITVPKGGLVTKSVPKAFSLNFEVNL